MACAEPVAPGRYAIGECIDGRYEIEGVLGQGGFGETYKAGARQPWSAEPNLPVARRLRRRSPSYQGIVIPDRLTETKLRTYDYS